MGKWRIIPAVPVAESTLENTGGTPDGVSFIKAPELWKQGITGRGVVVAVIDTGADVNHPEIKDRIIGVYNFTTDGSDGDVTDGNGHGTHVAGTIAGKTVGVAPGASLLIGKVLGKDGSGSVQGIVAAIKWATKWKGPNGERVRIISMSLGGPEDYSPLHVAIQNAVEAGILVVCAAGNDGDGSGSTDELDYPGAWPEVVEVGALDANWVDMAPFSNSNAELDLVAPGVGVQSSWPGGGYRKLSGTSMATPHVSGAAALVIQQVERDFGRELTEPEVYAQIIKRTTDMKWDRKEQGNGMLQLNVGYGGAGDQDPASLDLHQALLALKDLGCTDSPEAWEDLIRTIKKSPDHFPYPLQWLDLLMKKFYLALLRARK